MDRARELARLDSALAGPGGVVVQAVHGLGGIGKSTLAARNNLAHTYQAAGDLGRAMTLYEQIVTDSIRVLGKDHPQTKIVRGNLAVAREQSQPEPVRRPYRLRRAIGWPRRNRRLCGADSLGRAPGVVNRTIFQAPVGRAWVLTSSRRRVSRRATAPSNRRGLMFASSDRTSRNGTACR